MQELRTLLQIEYFFSREQMKINDHRLTYIQCTFTMMTIFETNLYYKPSDNESRKNHQNIPWQVRIENIIEATILLLYTSLYPISTRFWSILAIFSIIFLCILKYWTPTECSVYRGLTAHGAHFCTPYRSRRDNTHTRDTNWKE